MRGVPRGPARARRRCRRPGRRRPRRGRSRRGPPRAGRTRRPGRRAGRRGRSGRWPMPGRGSRRRRCAPRRAGGRGSLEKAVSVGASAPESGSSRSRRSASCTSARASSTRWRCPPESWPTWRRACSPIPTACERRAGPVALDMLTAAAASPRGGRRPGGRRRPAESGKSHPRGPSWGTNPVVPSTATVPAAGRTVPRRARSSVVLPAPFGPISPMTAPRGSVSETSSTREPLAECDGEAVDDRRGASAPSLAGAGRGAVPQRAGSAPSSRSSSSNPAAALASRAG